jgi:hypothetical protein
MWKGTAVHSVSRHKQRLQLLVGVGGVLVDLRQAVVDAAADVGGQGGEQVMSGLFLPLTPSWMLTKDLSQRSVA